MTDDRIRFQVETDRILDILSKDIYDSPNALLRENIQNAYDAILMRSTVEGRNLQDFEITVRIEPPRLTITDNGIGMDEEVLRNSFWKAGSSGKRTELAKQSGVIGTFGIGARANFGVCSALRVETRHVDSAVTLISTAERQKLSIAEDCIDLMRVSGDREPGTTLIADLGAGSNLHENNARSYLEPYVRFLPVRVLLNETNISQQSFEDAIGNRIRGCETLSTLDVIEEGLAFTIRLLVDPNGQVLVRITDMRLQDESIEGQLFLIQKGGQLFGLRNFFGLAPIPVSSYYELGGYANLSLLHPTAGREALSRESIDHVNGIIRLVESAVTDELAKTQHADRNTAFLHYISSHNKIGLAANVTAEVLPARESVPLGRLRDFSQNKSLYYYTGRDKALLQTFASSESHLIHISQVRPRRNVQLRYVNDLLKIEAVPDRATIIKPYTPSELSMAEAAFLVRLTNTLAEDYVMPGVAVKFAKISHGVAFLVEKQGDGVELSIGRNCNEVKPVVECYSTAYEVFGGFVKDFARVHVYPRCKDHVPSASRQGADALRTLLLKNRELYRYEEDEWGALEPLLADLLAGEASLAEVLTRSRRAGRPQSQRLRSDQVGQIEQELPDVVESPSVPEEETDEYEAAPAIIRAEIESRMKVLYAGEKYAQLNGFDLFLGLSDRLFRREGEFLHSPHTTKVIWASHRVIYIFTHASGRLTLYYDIELRQALEQESTGGQPMPTTTLITKNRIYVPVPEQLISAFKIVEGAREFFVRFDTIVGD